VIAVAAAIKQGKCAQRAQRGDDHLYIYDVGINPTKVFPLGKRVMTLVYPQHLIHGNFDARSVIPVRRPFSLYPVSSDVFYLLYVANDMCCLAEALWPTVVPLLLILRHSPHSLSLFLLFIPFVMSCVLLSYLYDYRTLIVCSSYTHRTLIVRSFSVVPKTLISVAF
jgi:hypothetical protein